MQTHSTLSSPLTRHSVRMASHLYDVRSVSSRLLLVSSASSVRVCVCGVQSCNRLFAGFCACTIDRQVCGSRNFDPFLVCLFFYRSAEEFTSRTIPSWWSGGVMI